MASPLEKGKISLTQLIFLLIANNVSASFIITVGTEAKQDAWLTVLLGTLIGLAMALFYLTLANRFPGKTLIAIHDIVWGPILGKIFSAIFLLFFLHEISLVIGVLILFQKEFLLTTPILFLALVGAGLAVLLASRGLEVVARCGQLIIMVCCFVWTGIFLMILPGIKLSNFQPVLQTPLPLFVAATLRSAAFNFSVGYVFLMIFPYVNDNHKILPTVIKGFVVIAIFLVTGVLATTGVLGPATEYFVYPALTASRLINIGEVFTRMEVLTGVIFWLGCFVLISNQLYCMMAASSELLRLKSLTTLALPLGILIAILSLTNFPNISEEEFFAMRVYTWEAFPFQYIFPLLTFLLAVIRKSPRGGS